MLHQDHRREPDEKRASGNTTTSSQHTNKTTQSGQVSTASADRITVQVSDSDSDISLLVKPRREKRPCRPLATFVTTCDAVPGYVTHVSYFSTRSGVALCTYSPFFEGRKHDFQNPNVSELISWVITEAAKRGDTIDAAEGIKRYNAARKCSRVETDIPFTHEKGRVYGRNYYRPGFLRNMSRMLYSQLLTWTKSEERSVPTVHLNKAVACGDVLRIWIGEDPIEGVPMFAYVGADVHHKLLWQAEKERRGDQERKKRERQAEAQRILDESQRRQKK